MRISLSSTGWTCLGTFSTGRRLVAAAALVVLVVAGAEPARAQETAAQPADSTLARQIRALEDITLAHRLAVYGERTREPLPLITAAEILLANPSRPLASIDPDTIGAGAVLPEPARLLAAARALAAGDETLLALMRPLERAAAQVVRGVPRGSARGPRQLYGRVGGSEKREHMVEFRGGEPAVVYVSGDGDSDLDVFVYDASGQLVASAVGPRDECVVRWTPVRQAAFRIEVRNVGRAPNWYWMATN